MKKLSTNFLKRHVKAIKWNFRNSIDLPKMAIFQIVAKIYSKLGDAPKALEYFLKADEYGDSWAYNEVIKIYREGKGTLKPDGQKLIEFLTMRLAKEETPDRTIICDIAEIYEEGCGSIEPDMKKALEFYRKAAELGNLYAEDKLVELIGSKL